MNQPLRTRSLYTIGTAMLMCLVSAQNTEAQTVSVDDALLRASTFFNQIQVQHAPGMNNAALRLAYTSKHADETYYYVFNRGTEEGFVIVGGDEAAKQILGYCDRGSFDYDKIPANMRWWLSQYDMQIGQAIEAVKLYGEVAHGHQHNRARMTTWTAVPTILTTEWDQNAPYNSQIPLYAEGFTGNNALATGCVATAGAQAMKHYKWPDQGVGTKTLTRTINDITFSADFASTTYDWDHMSNTYARDTYTGSTEDIAVGTLMYHVGIASDMNYGQLSTGGSGADMKDLAIGLATYFKYNRGMVYNLREYYTDAEWEEMVYNELKAGRPVVYGGQALAPDEGGHAFICDGYEDGRWHINWGWGGSYSGFFLLTANGSEKALRPAGTGSGGSSANASYAGDQHMITGMTPDTDDSSVAKIQAYMADGFSMAKTSFTPGETTYINGMIYSNSLFTETFKIAVKLVNTDDPSDILIVPSENTFNIEPKHGKGNAIFTLPYSAKPETSYSVYVMYEDENGDLQEALTKTTFSAPVISILKPAGISYAEDVKIDNDGYVTAEDFNLTFKLKNYGTSVLDYLYRMYVFPEGGVMSVDYFSLGTVSLQPNEEKSFELHYNDLNNKTLVKGSNYFVQLRNITDETYLGGKTDFFFRDRQAINYDLKPAGWGTICLPFEAEVPTGITAYIVTGVTDDKLNITEASHFEMNKPYLLTGTPGTYTFNGPVTPEGCYKNGLLYGSTITTQQYAPKNSYVLQKQDSQIGFYMVRDANSQKIRQYTAYLKVEGLSVTDASFLVIDDVTCIESVGEETPMETESYDLWGNRINAVRKGIQIVNGKKIVRW